MSKVCQITGRKAAVGNNVSHSKRRTKRKFKANLFNRRFFWAEQQLWIQLTVSAAGLRTINKIGLNAAIKQAAEKGYLTSIKTAEYYGKESKRQQSASYSRMHRTQRQRHAGNFSVYHDEESQEYNRTFGIEKIQSNSETRNCSQRN